MTLLEAIVVFCSGEAASFSVISSRNDADSQKQKTAMGSQRVSLFNRTTQCIGFLEDSQYSTLRAAPSARVVLLLLKNSESVPTDTQSIVCSDVEKKFHCVRLSVSVPATACARKWNGPMKSL